MQEYELPKFDPMGDLGRYVFRRSEEFRQKLRDLPHRAADKLAELHRGPFARTLTSGEGRLAIEALGHWVAPELVRIVNGPGLSDMARVAFINGNPAITIGNTIFMRPDRYGTDYSVDAKYIKFFIHEYAYVVQYKKLGYGSFFSRYGADLRKHRFDADDMYEFEERRTTYHEESLEGQAEMTGVYAGLRHKSGPAAAATRAALERRLRGSGVYGL